MPAGRILFIIFLKNVLNEMKEESLAIGGIQSNMSYPPGAEA